jgi:hypothetical protein
LQEIKPVIDEGRIAEDRESVLTGSLLDRFIPNTESFTADLTREFELKTSGLVEYLEGKE